MKQTAVQWLIESITLGLSEKGMITAFDKALEMEKEQIVNSWDDGFSNGFDLGKYDDDCKHDDGEQYYNETYETKETN
jgi:hypothetical protein